MNDGGTGNGRPREPAGSAVAEARRDAGLTERELAEHLGVSLWQMERLERGEIDARPYLAEVERRTGAVLAPPQHLVEEPRAAAPPAPLPSADAPPRGRLDGEGLLVLGSISALVLIRFFTEVFPVLPRAFNFVDVPIVLSLCLAAMLSTKPSPPLDRFARSLLPIATAFLLLTAVSVLANSSRVSPAPALVFLYGILSPLAVYRAVLKLWPPGCALIASRVLVALGVIQLAVATLVDIPRFVGENNPDVISGTFGTNAYQFVVFMLLFTTLVAGIYSFERERLTARLAPFLIGGAFIFIVLAQYRALLITIGLSLLLVSILLSARRGGGRGLIVGGVGILAFMAALAFGAQQVPILKLHETFEQSPTAVARKRLDIAGQVKDLYSANPRFVVTGTGPGTFSSRGWQTFALSESTSASNVQGSYALALTGGKAYTTDVSDRYVRPNLGVRGTGSVVAGSTAANSPFSDYTSVAAELGVLGVLLVVTTYIAAFVGLLTRTRRAGIQARSADSTPALLLTGTVGMFVLLQMAALDNWLEVTRLTFLIWTIAAIAIKEFDTSARHSA